VSGKNALSEFKLENNVVITDDPRHVGISLMMKWPLDIMPVSQALPPYLMLGPEGT
jgi:hypothetical protein